MCYDLPFFVDALCISQSREAQWLEERASLVRLMGAIYAKAVQVVIDLGEAQGNLKEVRSMILEFGSIGHDQWQYLLKHPKHLNKLSTPRFSSNVWTSLCTVCQRPWFYRVWVIQEYALAKRADFLLGTMTVLNIELRNSVARAFDLAGDLRHPKDSKFYNDDDERVAIRVKLSQTGNLMEAMQYFCDRHPQLHDVSSKQRTLSLSKALTRTQGFKATDKRDKLYALFGLTKHTDMSSFNIDYHESIQDLSRRLSMFLVQQGAVTSLICGLACRDNTSPSSWMVKLQDCYEARRLNQQDTSTPRKRSIQCWGP